MRLKIRNCVTDPAKKASRSRGQGVLRPNIMGKVLMPGAIRLVDADSMNQEDVDFLDFLIKNHCCSLTHIGVGMLDSCDAVYSFLGFDQKEVIAEEVKEEIVEELVVEDHSTEEVAEVVAEEPSVEEIEEALVEEAPIGYTKAELMNKKNAELREICQLVSEDAEVGGLAKKKLVAFILEHQ